jgi:hypothetical protein
MQLSYGSTSEEIVSCMSCKQDHDWYLIKDLTS